MDPRDVGLDELLKKQCRGDRTAEWSVCRVGDVGDFSVDELPIRLVQRTDEIFTDVLGNLKYGMIGLDIMIEVEHQMLKHNTEGSSFITGILIQGPGTGGSLEGVGRAGLQDLQPGRVLAFDFGVVLDGYHSPLVHIIF